MIDKQKYDHKKVDKLYHHLEHLSNQGVARDYEIRIDGMTCVNRTDDLSMFYQFEDLVDGSTNDILFKFYHGEGRRSQDYLFVFGEDMDEASNITDNERIDKEVAKRIEEYKRHHMLDQLKTETKKKDKTIERQQKRIEELESRHSDVLEMIQIGISGFASMNQSTTAAAQQPEDEIIQLLQKYRKEHGEITFQSSVAIALLLCENPDQIESARTFIKQEIEKHDKGSKAA